MCDVDGEVCFRQKEVYQWAKLWFTISYLSLEKKKKKNSWSENTLTLQKNTQHDLLY